MVPVAHDHPTLNLAKSRAQSTPFTTTISSNYIPFYLSRFLWLVSDWFTILCPSSSLQVRFKFILHTITNKFIHQQTSIFDSSRHNPWAMTNNPKFHDKFIKIPQNSNKTPAFIFLFHFIIFFLSFFLSFFLAFFFFVLFCFVSSS